jgi:hypothetical protein
MLHLLTLPVFPPIGETDSPRRASSKGRGDDNATIQIGSSTKGKQASTL